MDIDFESLSVDEILKIKSGAEQALIDHEKKRKQLAVDEIKQVAEKHGFSVGDLLEGNKKSKAVKLDPKYRNPKNPAETWTGRGRKPKWLTEAIEAGDSLDSFEIS